MSEIDTDYRTKTGATIEDLAQWAYELYRALITPGENSIAWVNIPEQDQWVSAVEIVADQCIREVSTTWEDLVRRVRNAFDGTDKADDGPEGFIWEAVVRHTCNAITCEDPDDWKNMENSDVHWKKWYLAKLRGESYEHDSNRESR